MSEIKAIYDKDPGFPATNQHPDAVRSLVGPYVVDAIGATPTIQEIEVFLGIDSASLAAKDAEMARIQQIEEDAQYVAMLNTLKSASAAQIDAYVDAQVTNLADARELFKRILKLLALVTK